MENDQTQPIQSLTTPLPPETTPPISPLAPKPSQLPIVVLSLLSLIFLSGMVYFYFQAQSMKERGLETMPSPTPQTITANPTSTPEQVDRQISDEMSNWQTYTNQKYGFSFKYPLDWKVAASPTTGDEFNIIVDKKSNKSETGFVPFQISVNMTQNQDGKVILTTLSEAKSYFLKSFESSSVKTNSITIGDKPGVVLTGVMAGPGPGEGQFISYTLVQLDKKVLVIQLGNKSYQSSFDQIISTFKFSN